MTHLKEPSPQRLARIAGVLYLLLAFIGPFSMMFVPSKVIVPGDAAATASNILGSEGLFRAAFLGDSAVVVVQGINMLPNFIVLHLLKGQESAIPMDQVYSMVRVALDARASGVLVWEVFFALHLVLLGYLFYRSGYIPKVFGILLEFAAAGYFIHAFGMMLSPAHAPVYSTIVAITSIFGEVALTLWLLIKGVRVPLAD